MQGKRDIVVVPTFDRPEMLAVCLKHIAAAEGVERMRILVSIDSHVNQPPKPEINEVIELFKAKLDIRATVRKTHNTHGNSLNVLFALKEAYEQKTEFVFLIEDDVIVAPDFFKWHYAVHRYGNWFASIATECTRRVDVLSITDPQKYFISACDYASLGVCFSRWCLAKIVPHVSLAYCNDMTRYVGERFPRNRFSREYSEQDGLIIRIMADNIGMTAWPYVPRAFHIGWYGYHRPLKEPQAGDIWERSERIEKLIVDPTALAQVSENAHDVHPVKLEIPHWTSLYIEQRFD